MAEDSDYGSNHPIISEQFFSYFHGSVQEVWMAQTQGPNPFKCLDQKLRATAKWLASWSSKFVGSIKMQILLAGHRVDSSFQRCYGISAVVTT
jgi:hypothetical protein